MGGLVKFADAGSVPERPHFLTFDTADGLQGRQFARGAALASRNGELYFGGARGLSWFRPAEVVENLVAPPVVFTGLRIFGTPVAIGRKVRRSHGRSSTRGRSRSPRGHDGDLRVRSAQLPLPAKNRYLHKLDGLDRNQSAPTADASVSYAKLPRDVPTEVRASNNDGVWNEKGASLVVRVTPPSGRNGGSWAGSSSSLRHSSRSPTGCGWPGCAAVSASSHGRWTSGPRRSGS